MICIEHLSFFLSAKGNIDIIDITSLEPTCIAGILKQFLRELPNPVICEALYPRFIDAAS